MGNRLLNLSLDSKKGVLTFSNLLPNIPASSMLYEDLTRFLKSRSDRTVPNHRRVDSRRAEITWTNRRGNVWIALNVLNDQYAYGLKKLVNIIHEIFVMLNDSYSDYMHANFDASQE